MITAAQIKKFCPAAKSTLVDAIIANWSTAEKAGINTDLRIQHFMAQIATETGGLTTVEENLNYTSAQRIYDVFKGPSSSPRFKSVADAKPYVRQPQKLAILVYGGRLGNASAPSTDGWDFRGGGMLQTSGRTNYAKMGFEADPEQLRDPAVAFNTAVREWGNRGCNKLADNDDVTAIRKAINGGTNGLADAKTYLAKAKKIFVGDATASVQPAAQLDLVSIPQKQPTATQNDVITQVQQLLRDKGYPEVGDVDGKFGTRTRNAILAFQADNDLPLTGKVTDDLLAQLIKAPKREMAPERANATSKDLKDNSIVKSGDLLKKAGGVIVAGSGLGGLMNGTGSLDDVTDGLNRVHNLWTTVSALGPWLIAGVAGVAIFYFGHHFISKYVEAYREGRAL